MVSKKRLTAREVVRCARCGRLAERRSAMQYEGRWYGSNCVLKALATSNVDFDKESQGGDSE